MGYDPRHDGEILFPTGLRIHAGDHHQQRLGGLHRTAGAGRQLAALLHGRAAFFERGPYRLRTARGEFRPSRS